MLLGCWLAALICILAMLVRDVVMTEVTGVVNGADSAAVGQSGGGGINSGGVNGDIAGGGFGGISLSSFSSTHRLFTRDKMDFSPAFIEVDFILSRLAPGFKYYS